jgi:hypothetical protein
VFRKPFAQRAQPPSAAGGDPLDPRPHPGQHPAPLRLDALDLHLVAAPDEVVAFQRGDEQHRQQQIAAQPIERIKQRRVPIRRCGQQHLAAIPERAESDGAKRHRPAEFVRQIGHADRRQHAAGKNLRHKVEKEARTAQPRPAQLAIPHFRSGAVAERLRQRPVDEPHLVAGLAHDLGGGGVFGDFLGERFDAAGLFEIGAAPQHGFALGEAAAETIDQILPARLVSVEKRAFDFGPESMRQRADRRRGDQAGVLAPAGEQPLNVIVRHQHVAVGDDDPVMRRCAPALEQVVELGIGADAVVAD